MVLSEASSTSASHVHAHAVWLLRKVAAAERARTLQAARRQPGLGPPSARALHLAPLRAGNARPFPMGNRSTCGL